MDAGQQSKSGWDEMETVQRQVWISEMGRVGDRIGRVGIDRDRDRIGGWTGRQTKGESTRLETGRRWNERTRCREMSGYINKE